MKPPQDPPRLLDPGSDAPAWLRSTLQAGARDVPGPERLARIAARLPSGPGPAGPPPPPPPAPVPPVPSVLSGAAVGAALGLAVVGAGWLASPRAEAPPARSPVPSVTATAAAPEPLRPGPTQAPAPRLRPRSERAEPLPSGMASAASSVGNEPPSSPATPGPEMLATESEASILMRAQDALRGEPARALALTDLHLARFPGGRLLQDREVIAVTALLGMGRAAEARARATRFLASFPTSADGRRLLVLIPDLESPSTLHKDPREAPSTP